MTQIARLIIRNAAVTVILSFYCVVFTVDAAKTKNDGRTQNDVVLPSDAEFKEYDKATIRVITGRSYKPPMPDSTTARQTTPGEDVVLNITTFGRNFTLNLKVNTYLVSNSFTVFTQDELGRLKQQSYANQVNAGCYYIGGVSNEPDSLAAVSMCSGFRAQVATTDELYHIEPLSDKLDGEHRAYRQSDSNLPTATCGNAKYKLQNTADMKNNLRRRKRAAATLNWPQDLPFKTRLVELYVVNDYSQFVAQSRSFDKVVARMFEIYNYASGLHSKLDVYISIVGAEIWSQRDLFNVTTNASITLDDFSKYRSANITTVYNDNAQFVTAQFDGNTDGIGYVGTMCSPYGSVSVISDQSSVPGYTGNTAAHEMGHNFGMRHDNDPGSWQPCTCSDPNGRCLMNSYNGSDTWSSCAAVFMNNFFKSVDSYCLNDFHNVLYSNQSFCGNGIVENGEECDCGQAPLTDCNPKCCNATTCRLVSHANCSSGLCCNITECQLKPITTVCRAAESQCDLAEYCSGVSNTCPSNVYLQDGSSCTVDGSNNYCYAGKCKSQATQCQLWWGPGVKASDPRCYPTFNMDGEEYGNCGIDKNIPDKYIPCSASNVNCGKLFCDIKITNESKLAFSLMPAINGVKVFDSSFTQSPSSKVYYCTSGTHYLGDNIAFPDIGDVPDGAACGTNKMCVNKNCVSTSTILNYVTCPNCNQNGVCNNIGQCHCDSGYAPPNCDLPGNGGSFHSNAICIPLPVSILTTSSESNNATTLPTTQTASYSISTSSGSAQSSSAPQTSASNQPTVRYCAQLPSTVPAPTTQETRNVATSVPTTVSATIVILAGVLSIIVSLPLFQCPL